MYGRRKTGKTFIARRTLKDYHYYIVRRNRLFYDPDGDYEMPLPGVLRECRLGARIIIDEFHRADPKLFDAIQAGTCGEAVLITSTLHYYRRLVEGSSAPLAGLLRPFRVPLLEPRELLSSPTIRGMLEADPRSGLMRVVFYQEPAWLGASMTTILYGAYDYTLSLAGEILDEEDATLTRRLLGLLAATAAGKERLSEITNYMYSRGYLPRPETGLVTKYLQQAVRVGLLERVPLHGGKRHVYRHVSPVTDLAFYLQEKYNAYDIPLAPETVARLAENRVPFHVERFIERLLAAAYELRPVRVLRPQVDIALARGRKLVLAAEVKWRRQVSPAEIRRDAEKLAGLAVEKKMIVVPDKTGLPEPVGIELVDVHDLISIATRSPTG